jgi:hypothetical protein
MPNRYSSGDAFQARATHASHRANLCCLGLSVGIAIALSGCGPSQRDYTDDSDFSVHYRTGGIWLVHDKATGCEYIANARNGGIVLRADPKGLVTPDCPASGMPLREDPKGLRPKAGSPVPKGDAQ